MINDNLPPLSDLEKQEIEKEATERKSRFEESPAYMMSYAPAFKDGYITAATLYSRRMKAERESVPLQQQGWVSVKEKLPDVHGRLLVFCKERVGVTIAEYCGVWIGRGVEKPDCALTVTAWMPLPSAPVE